MRFFALSPLTPSLIPSLTPGLTPRLTPALTAQFTPRRHLTLGAVFIALFASNFLANSVHSAAETGKSAPSFSTLDTQGKIHRLNDYAGKYVVLEWVNPGCPFVKKHYQALPPAVSASTSTSASGKSANAIGNIPATQQEAVAKGMVWLAISSTEKGHPDWLAPAPLTAWLKDRGSVANAVLLDEDGAIGKAYGARTTPHLYIINPSGQLVYAGGIDSIASARVDALKTATNYVAPNRGRVGGGQTGEPAEHAALWLLDQIQVVMTNRLAHRLTSRLLKISEKP